MQAGPLQCPSPSDHEGGGRLLLPTTGCMMCPAPTWAHIMLKEKGACSLARLQTGSSSSLT
jgi:hypothetical protein